MEIINRLILRNLENKLFQTHIFSGSPKFFVCLNLLGNKNDSQFCKEQIKYLVQQLKK